MQSEAEKVPREERRNVTEVPSNELEEVLRCHVFFPIPVCIYIFLMLNQHGTLEGVRPRISLPRVMTWHGLRMPLGWLPLCNELAIC